MLKNKKILLVISFAVLFCVVDSLLARLASAAVISSNSEDSASVAVSGKSTETSKKTDNLGISGNYLASRFSHGSGDIESATNDLLAVYKHNPNEIEVGNQLIGLYLLSGKVGKAMEIATKLAQANPKGSIPALMLSLRSIKNNDSAGAYKVLNPLFYEEGGQLWLPLIAGWLDADAKKLKTPLTMEELSAEVGQTAPIVSYNLALINAKAGFIETAAEDFKYAIASVGDKKNPPIRVMQMLLQFSAQNNSPETLTPIISDYLAANPSLKDGKMPFVSSIQDGVAEVLYTMGSIMLAGDVAQEATLYLQLAIYLRPDFESAILTLAEAYRDLNQYAIADELLARIPQTSVLYPTADLYSAMNLAALKKYDFAISKLNKLIDDNNYNVEAYMVKGDLLREQDRFAEAASVYETAIAGLKDKKGKNWPLFFALATCYDKLGKWEIAEKNLHFALDASPNQPDVLNYLGYSLLTRGEKITEAKGYIEKAVQIRPEDPQIMDSMGFALYLTGDYENAATYLEGSVSLLPADATVNDHLGDVYYRLGRKNEAKFQWERVLTYTKDVVILEEIRKKLKDGLPEATAENTIKIMKSASIE